jgi:hypothetical protein
MGIKIHNSLPSELKRIENVEVFKNKLKTLFITKLFYDLIGNRTCDLTACNIVTQPTTLSRAPTTSPFEK